jgi:hypothetical protein
MAIPDTKRTYPANYLRAPKSERPYVSGKQPSEFTSLRESGQLVFSETKPPGDKFTKALASVLSADPKKIRDKEAQAKTEKPSPHKKYTYAPEEGQP